MMAKTHLGSSMDPAIGLDGNVFRQSEDSIMGDESSFMVFEAVTRSMALEGKSLHPQKIRFAFSCNMEKRWEFQV